MKVYVPPLRTGQRAGYPYVSRSLEDTAFGKPHDKKEKELLNVKSYFEKRGNLNVEIQSHRRRDPLPNEEHIRAHRAHTRLLGNQKLIKDLFNEEDEERKVPEDKEEEKNKVIEIEPVYF